MKRLLGRLGTEPAVSENLLQATKRRAIDAGFERLRARSFADLGGVWAVEGGYTLYALERFSIDRAVLVDTGITEPVRRRAAREPRLELVHGDFTEPDIARSVGTVDAVLMFDVLLHQVRPDWDEVLQLYAPLTRAFVIVNPQYIGGHRTVRLLDLGKERYDQLVPSSPVHDNAWAHLDEVHPTYGLPYRDIHEIWQWGIVDADLDAVCRRLGFERVYYENAGVWRDLLAFENHAFVYARIDRSKPDNSETPEQAGSRASTNANDVHKRRI